MTAEAGPRAGANASSPMLMVLLLAMTYGLAYYDRLMMSVVGELVKHEFALSDKQLSLLTGASFVVIYGTFGILAGWLVDRESRKRILIGALLLYTAMTVACGMAQSWLQLALARAGVGVGEAANVPTGISAIADRYPVAKRPLAIGIFYAGGTLGILISFLGGTWVAAEYGWRMAFLVAGPPGLLIAALIALFFREPARESYTAALGSQTGPVTAPKTSTFILIAQNRPLVWLLFGGAIATFMNVGLLQWLPNFFLRSHDLSLKEVGLYFGPVLAGGMSVGLLAGGWLGNRIAARSVTNLIWTTAGIVFALIPMYLLIFWLPSLAGAMAATFVGTTMSVLYAPSYNTAWQSLCDPRARGTAAGVSSFANAMIGGAGCTYVVGMMSDAWAPAFGKDSLRYAMSAGLLFCLVSALLFVYAARMVSASEQRSCGA